MNVIAAFLKKWVPILTPPWLSAVNAHIFFSGFITLVVAIRWPRLLWPFVIVQVIVAGIKEFYIDKHDETTRQTFRMNLTDFATYMAGIALALLLR